MSRIHERHRGRDEKTIRSALIGLIKVRGFAYVDPERDKKFRDSLTEEERRRIT